jgi:hypothetical protein
MGRPRKNPLPNDIPQAFGKAAASNNFDGKPVDTNFMQVVGDLPSSQPTTYMTVATTPNRILRDVDGLLINIKHSFKGNGFVDWRAMIPFEHVVLNREKFLKKDTPVDVDKLSEVEYKALFDKSEDKDKLIKLAGLKEVAQIRGYDRMTTEVKEFTSGPVATCKIDWLPNFETNFRYVQTTGVGEANHENTKGVAGKYLAAIAENRAVSRAIRSFLMIHTVSDEEVKYQNTGEFGEKPDAKSGPQYVLEKKLYENKKSFVEFQQFILENSKDGDFVSAEVWEKPGDMSAGDATSALGLMESFLKKK